MNVRMGPEGRWVEVPPQRDLVHPVDCGCDLCNCPENRPPQFTSVEEADRWLFEHSPEQIKARTLDAIMTDLNTIPERTGTGELRHPEHIRFDAELIGRDLGRDRASMQKESLSKRFRKAFGL